MHNSTFSPGRYVRLYEQLESMGKNVSQLPNWQYAVAVARFYVAEEEAKKKNSPGGTAAVKAPEEADDALQRALIAFPGVLLPMLDKCSVEATDRVTKHRYFLEAGLHEPAGLALLERLYVGRSHHVWKHPELLPWLERNADEVIRRVDSGKDILVEEFAGKRKTRYQGVPRNIHRHVIMSDIPDATTSLPKVRAWLFDLCMQIYLTIFLLYLGTGRHSCPGLRPAAANRQHQPVLAREPDSARRRRQQRPGCLLPLHAAQLRPQRQGGQRAAGRGR